MNRRDFITRGIISSGTFGIVGSSLANQYKFGSQNQMGYHYQLPKFKAEAYKKALSFELSQIMPMYEEAYEAACITQ